MNSEEIEKILETAEPDFEEALQVQGSPLNQPVSVGDIGLPSEEPLSESEEDTSTDEPLSQAEDDEGHDPFDALDDVPEQVITESDDDPAPEASPDLPDSHARATADALLGITDNVLTIGGGYFVRIRKHAEFYEFDEVIHIIDEQNDKNVQRMTLDAEDKILLRPLLMVIVKKRAKQLTPEQQFLGAVISILMKKFQIVMQVRAENEMLVQRILHIVRPAAAAVPTEPEPSVHEPTMPVDDYSFTADDHDSDQEDPE